MKKTKPKDGAAAAAGTAVGAVAGLATDPVMPERQWLGYLGESFRVKVPSY